MVENLAAGVTSRGEALTHLCRHAEFRQNVFAALNTAFLHDGALVMVPREVAVAAPLHLLFVQLRKTRELSALPGGGRNRQRGDDSRGQRGADRRDLFPPMR